MKHSKFTDIHHHDSVAVAIGEHLLLHEAGKQAGRELAQSPVVLRVGVLGELLAEYA